MNSKVIAGIFRSKGRNVSKSWRKRLVPGKSRTSLRKSISRLGRKKRKKMKPWPKLKNSKTRKLIK